jgi:hypothetical protein
MRQRLRALKDCAENPTRADRERQRNDPNYRRATTEVIEDAERNLKLNTTIRSSLQPATPSPPCCCSAKSKPVSLLGKLEEKLLQHVAEEYIMKDAGKGVVPCKPDCGPVYSPAPPTEQEASYPPAEMSCEQPQPEQLVCAAAPASHTPGPSRPATPPPADLRRADHAQFTYTYTLVDSGCSSFGCSTSTVERFYGSPLFARTELRIPGQGHGSLSGNQPYGGDRARPCSWSRSSDRRRGSADLIVNAYFRSTTA